MSDNNEKLVGKILKVMKAVGAVEKGGYNSFQKYKYLAHADLMKALHPELIKEGLLMYPASTTVVRSDTVDKRNTTVVNNVYAITDGKETILFSGVGEGVDNGDKASYKAQTGAHKYALKGLLTLPDELDAESDEKPDYEGLKVGNSTQKAGKRRQTKIEELEHLIGDELKEKIFDKYRVMAWEDLPKDVAERIIDEYTRKADKMGAKNA